MTDSISIIVPAYNEESSLRAVLDEIDIAMAECKSPWEIVVVDDGSTDRTKEIANEFIADRPHARLVAHHRNQGSGSAIRTGLESSRMNLAIYVPADGQFDPAEILRFSKKAHDADIVLGVRDSRSDYSLRRRIQSSVYIWLVNRMFGQCYRDLNWVHLWRRAAVGNLTIGSRGVFFLQEVIDQARRAGLRVVEIDSRYRPRSKGRAKGGSARTILRTLSEMIAYRKRIFQR